MTHSTVRDADPVLTIDVHTRRVIVPGECKTIGAVGDHHSNVLTIECPRFIDGHDVAGCALKWIGWTDARGNCGRQNIGAVEKTPELVRMAWKVSAAVTAAPGAVSFTVHFADTAPDGSIVYHWSTGACKDLHVVESVAAGPEPGVGMVYTEEKTDSGLLDIEVDDGALNAKVYNAVRGVLYG